MTHEEDMWQLLGFSEFNREYILTERSTNELGDQCLDWAIKMAKPTMDGGNRMESDEGSKDASEAVSYPSGFSGTVSSPEFH